MTTITTRMTDTAAPSSSTAPPSPPSPPSPPAPPSTREQTVVLRECAICQSSIFPAEETQPCPKCGLVFHAECWHENYGCASYGCDQVNVLAPRIDIPSAAAPLDLPPPSDEPGEPLPWDFLLLGAAALAMAASSLSYGLPSLLAAGGVAWRMHRKHAYRSPILVAAAALCLVGIVGGIVVSRFWFSQVDFDDARG